VDVTVAAPSAVGAAGAALLTRTWAALWVECPDPSATVTTSEYSPSATPCESQTVRADQVSGSDAWGAPVAVPTCVTVPLGPVIDHVAVPAPSPVRASTLNATDPLNVLDAGSVASTTGLDVAAVQVALAVWACVVSGPPARTGTMLYADEVPVVPPVSVRLVAVVVAIKTVERKTW
jgi:hypothetical protein